MSSKDIAKYVKKFQKYKYLLIDQVNYDVNHLVGLCLLGIVSTSKSKLFGKEPVMKIFVVIVVVMVNSLDYDLGLSDGQISW